MSANLLPKLPTELIIQIFKSTNNLATATALSISSHRFQSIWQANSASICHAVVRTIPCYDQACEYVKAQTPDATSPEKTEDMGLVTLKLAKKLFDNADIASQALRYYEEHVVENVARWARGPSSLTESQRICFVKAWYRICTLASLPSDSLPYSMLASLDFLEFQQMVEAIRWVVSTGPYRLRPELQLGFHHCRPKCCDWQLPKPPSTAKCLNCLKTPLIYLSQDLRSSSLDNQNFGRGYSWALWRFMAHEFCLDIKESGKGSGWRTCYL